MLDDNPDWVKAEIKVGDPIEVPEVEESELDKFKGIIASVNVEKISESDLCPVYPGGEPHIVIANVHIPLEIGKILVSEAKILHEQKKLEKLKANLTK